MPRQKLTITDTDRGMRDLLARCKSANTSITVGVHGPEGGETHEGGGSATVADVANYNEFGTWRIPARSFIGAWFDEYYPENRGHFTDALRAVVKGPLTLAQALAALGALFVGQVQRRIVQGIPPPNAERTIQRKGSSKPLVDTGQLKSSITYKVEDSPK